MSPDVPSTDGPDGAGPQQWEQMLRAMLGPAADDAIREMRELGVDPADGLLDGLSRPPLSREWNEAQAEL